MKQKLRLLMMTLLCAVVSTAWGADKWVKTAPSSLQTGDIVVIVDQTSSRAMSNNNGTESAPSATSVTLNDDKSEISSEVNANIQWEVTVSNNSYQFGVANTSNYLYCTATNNGVRVGTNENNLFTWEIADANNSEYYLHNSATSRYIGVYSSQDWRCYSSVNNNIKNTLTALYKKTSSQGPTAPNISISSETVEVGKTINIIVPSDLTSVEYESDDPSIASVDEDGEITGNSVGSAEITVTWAAVNGVYNAGEKTFSITVTAPVVATVYEEVTSTNQLVAGNEYILVATEYSVAMGAPNAGNNKIRDKVDVIIQNNQVSITNQEVTKLTLGGVSGAWTFYASDTENYLALNGNSNEVHSAAEVNDNSKWTITSDFQLCNTSQADTRYIMYNSSSPRFACYKSGQKKAVLFVKEGSSTNTKAEPGFSFSATTAEANMGEPFTAPTFTNPNNVEVTFESSVPTVATIDESGNVNILAAGTTVISATSEETTDYLPGSASYTLTVIDPNAPGTENNPYTVTEARAAIDAGTGVDGVYATGIVSKIVTAYNSQFGNITYNISEDGTESSVQLQAYRGKSYNGDNFTSVDDIKVGDIVVIYGNLIKYGDTYEFAQNNQLVSLSREVESSITVNTTSIDVPAAETEGTIGVTFTNFDPDPELTEIVFYEADGTTETTCDWIIAEIDGNNIEYVVDANNGEARTAYLKVYSLDNDGNDVYSELITITQAAPTAPVEDYATLPFEFDGGKADIEGTSGLTQEGLDSDYGSSPKLKFNGTGDYVILKFNERPGKLTFDLKGNSFSGGTFTVQTSEDGETYTDLKTYNNDNFNNTVHSETFEYLGENVRYIKWIYTNKVSGNVALGNIVLAKYEEPQSYTVTITQPDNAEIFVFYNDPDNNWPDIQSGDEVLSGSEVMVSTSASEGYQIENVTVTDENEQEIELTEAEEGISWTFIMPSSNVTIACTVTEIPEPSDEEWVLTDFANLTEDDIFVIVGNNGDTYAMSNDKGANGAPTAVSVTISGDKITSVVADNIKWNISGNATDGYTFYPNGDEDTWLYTTNSNNGVRVGTSDNKTFTINSDYLYNTATSRYIGIYNSQDWRCYTSINSNIENQTFGFYKLVKPEPQDEPFTFTISDRATDGETCYATIADLGAGYFKVEGNVEVSTVVINENKQLSYPITFQENDVIPGQGAYLVKGAAGEYTFPTAEEGTVTDLGENMLISSGMGDVSADNMLAIAKAATNHEGDFKFYKLSLNGKSEAGSVGFYWGAANGAAFNYTKAHQAFLAVSQTGESGAGVAAFLFDGDKTGIYNVMATESESNNDTYTLSGIRVENKQLPKGIYIKNGKKVVVR